MSEEYRNNHENDDSLDNLSQSINQAKDAYDTGKKISDWAQTQQNRQATAQAGKNIAQSSEMAKNASDAGNLGKTLAESGKVAETGAGAVEAGSLGTGVGAAEAGGAVGTGVGAGAGASAGATAGGTTATAVAAGAPTAGIGALIVLALAGIFAGAKEFDDVLSGKPPKIGTLPLVAFLLSIIGIIFISFISNIPSAVFNKTKDTVWESFEETAPGVADGIKYIADLITGTDTDKRVFFEELLEGTEYEGYEDTILNTQTSFDAANLFIYEKIIDKAIIDSLEVHCKNFIYDPSKIVKILFDDYDAIEAEKQFLALPYPYCLVKEDGGKWTIEDAINGNIPDDELNNDLNYLEIITVLCQNEDISLNGFTFSKFYDLLCNGNLSKLLYEMEMETDIPVYFYVDNTGKKNIIEDIEEYKKDYEEQEAAKQKDLEDDGMLDEKAEYALTPYKYYYEVKIYPYGLKELYAIADVDYLDYNFNNSNILNRDALTLSENAAITYLQSFAYDGLTFLQERNKNSLWYTLIKDRLSSTPTGRSPYSYIDVSVRDIALNDYGLEIWDLPNHVTEDAYLTITGDSVILDIPRIIKQGNFKDIRRGDGRLTVAEAACIDCSYMMLMEYYSGNRFSVPYVCTEYVSGQSFQYGRFLSANGGVLQRDHAVFSIQEIRNSITEGKPVVFHLKGVWKYNGVTYHKSANNHYILITGYDETGFYVHDPGSLNGTKTAIPYAAFDYVNEKWLVYTSYASTSWTPKYKINTLLEKEEVVE